MLLIAHWLRMIFACCAAPSAAPSASTRTGRPTAEPAGSSSEAAVQQPGTRQYSAGPSPLSTRSRLCGMLVSHHALITTTRLVASSALMAPCRRCLPSIRPTQAHLFAFTQRTWRCTLPPNYPAISCIVCTLPTPCLQSAALDATHRGTRCACTAVKICPLLLAQVAAVLGSASDDCSAVCAVCGVGGKGVGRWLAAVAGGQAGGRAVRAVQVDELPRIFPRPAQPWQPLSVLTFESPAAHTTMAAAGAGQVSAL